MEGFEVHQGYICSRQAELFDLLLKNVHTLRHIKMLFSFQTKCYLNLYRHCYNLKSLDIDNGSELYKTDDLPCSEDWMVELTEDDSPFQLEVFKGRAGMEDGMILPYMGNLRVVHGLDWPAWQDHQRLRFLELLA